MLSAFKIKYITPLFVSLFLFSCMTGGSHPAKRIGVEKRDIFTVKGEVLWQGPAPIVYPVPTAAYRGACGKRQAMWILKLRKTRLWHMRLLDIAVWLEPLFDQMTPEEVAEVKMRRGLRHREPINIVEKECRFNPSLIVVPVGTKIEITNEDRKDHWFIVQGKHRPRAQYVQYYGETPSVFTFETPGIHNVPKGQPVKLIADKVDKLHLISGFHMWMDAWIVITERFWFDEMVDKKGIFEIKDVPKGVYRVHTWHPVLGDNSTVVRVPEDIHELISVKYNETPFKYEKIPSTIITTTGEIRQEKDIWHSIDDW